ncbi:MAG TPA: glycosyl hydrolase, partial [Ktedonobacteraceae bacterium]|nr:glycosyl hydrolase [Ktedonobacteraceae bacterium]
MKHLNYPRLIVLLLILAASAAMLYALWLHNKGASTETAAAAAPAMISNAPNVPTIGNPKFGMYVDSPTPTAIENSLGKKLAILGQFIHFNQPLANSKLAYACRQGYVPLISWESWLGPNKDWRSDPYPLADIAAGKFDDLLKTNLKAVAAMCKDQTILLRVDQEMDQPIGVQSYTSWQGNPTAYIAAWRHIVGLARAIDPKMLFIWSPNRATDIAKLYYPGDQWVDYVGLTLNRNGAVVSQSGAPTSFSQFYEQNQAIEDYGKPVIIGETTTLEEPGNPAFKANWIADMLAYSRTNPKIVALV